MRQPKSKKQLGRKRPHLKVFSTVLIICEGEKSEPNYFKGAIRRHKLGTAKVKVQKNDCGSAPISVVECAKKFCKQLDSDEVFCVFDKDDHKSFNDAISQISALNKSNRWPKFTAIISDPCFEIWVVLHFTYTTKQYASVGKTSKCDRVNKELKAHMSYKKKDLNLYEALASRYGTALKNAGQLRSYIKRTGASGPSTNIDELIKRLEKLKR